MTNKVTNTGELDALIQRVHIAQEKYATLRG